MPNCITALHRVQRYCSSPHLAISVPETRIGIGIMLGDFSVKYCISKLGKWPSHHLSRCDQRPRIPVITPAHSWFLQFVSDDSHSYAHSLQLQMRGELSTSAKGPRQTKISHAFSNFHRSWGITDILHIAPHLCTGMFGKPAVGYRLRELNSTEQQG